LEEKEGSFRRVWGQGAETQVDAIKVGGEVCRRSDRTERRKADSMTCQSAVDAVLPPVGSWGPGE